MIKVRASTAVAFFTLALCFCFLLSDQFLLYPHSNGDFSPSKMEEPRLHPHLTEVGVECPLPGAGLLSSPQTFLFFFSPFHPQIPTHTSAPPNRSIRHQSCCLFYQCCVVLCCPSSDLKIFLSSSSPTSTPQPPSPPPPCLDRKIHRRLLFLFSSQVAFTTNPRLNPRPNPRLNPLKSFQLFFFFLGFGGYCCVRF
ncbi:hypothetical protein Droror1_Dr00014971 [Drosera rotundifolia]